MPENIVHRIPVSSLPDTENVLKLTALFMILKSALSPIIKKVLTKEPENGPAATVVEREQRNAEVAVEDVATTSNKHPRGNHSADSSYLAKLNIKVVCMVASLVATAMIGKARGCGIDLISAVTGVILYKTTEKIVAAVGNQFEKRAEAQQFISYILN